MTPSPQILGTPSEMRAWRSEAAGQVGFVPTMGALHRGHGELLGRMRSRVSGPNDRVVLSIFVNPTQFGPNEDLAKYPRTFDADLALARSHGVDAIFFPTPENMYPSGYSTYVEETQLSTPLCGASRAGHFRGVTTVVLKLFNLVEPNVAYFGLKDAQQFFVLHKMARDLNLRVSVEGIPTVREPDGLALSSRNAYLSPRERELAPAIRRELSRAAEILGGAGAPDAYLAQARQRLTALGFVVEYLELRSLPDLQTLEAAPTSSAPTLLAIAARLGSTRLIDNVILHPGALASHGITLHP